MIYRTERLNRFPPPPQKIQAPAMKGGKKGRREGGKGVIGGKEGRRGGVYHTLCKYVAYVMYAVRRVC